MSESDDPARFAYLAEGNARQARKRVAADILIRDNAGRVLLVDPTYKPGWDLPGGMVEANEAPSAAASRELREEVGLTLLPQRVLVLEWVAPHGPWDDSLVFVFDGGTLTDEQSSRLRITDREIGAFEFVDLDTAANRLRDYVWQRLARAVHVANGLRGAPLDYNEPTITAD